MIEEMDDIAVDERNEERLLALEIMNGRKCTNTKKQYQSRIEHFTKWVETKHPTCLNEHMSVNLSVINKAIMNEFGHICKKKEKRGAYLEPVVFHAFQHVSGYKCAIHSDMEVNITEDTLKMFKQFLEGYVRTIAQLKQDGVMALIEGKQPMSFNGFKFLAAKALEQKTDLNLSPTVEIYRNIPFI
jgi:hypothetical protein